MGLQYSLRSSVGMSSLASSVYIYTDEKNFDKVHALVLSVVARSSGV